jgi:hypothetical protein
MKFFCIILFFLITTELQAQSFEEVRLFIEGDQVVLQFTPDQWESGMKDSTSLVNDFKELNVMEAINAGTTASWAKDGWILRKLNVSGYQIRKSLNDFNHEFSNVVKYQINSDTWTGPISEPIIELNENRQPVKKIKEAKVSANGNALFKLKGKLKAKRVILTGSFNHWNEQAIIMNKSDTGWETRMDLPPGIYEYKYIIDGEWTHDKSNPLQVLNEHYTLNSILLVGEKITFTLNGFKKAKRVILAGSFNNWDEHSMAMKKTADGWEYNLPLPPGKHYYKYIIDDQWHLDPDNMMRQRDKENHVNSVILIH